MAELLTVVTRHGSSFGRHDDRHLPLIIVTPLRVTNDEQTDHHNHTECSNDQH
jgi:hypothetical protein